MAKHNVWMSVSDLMTGLMVIFLFVAVAYMIQVKDNQRLIDDYIETKQNLHEKLVNEFKGDTAKWKMVVGKDLSMKFKEPEVLFALGSDELQPRFKDILDKFIPKYLGILLEDTTLRGKISEIRIEGHTDSEPIQSAIYPSNWELSSARTWYFTRTSSAASSRLVRSTLRRVFI